MIFFSYITSIYLDGKWHCSEQKEITRENIPGKKKKKAFELPFLY